MIWTVHGIIRVIDGDSVILDASIVLDDNGTRIITERWPRMKIRLVTLDTPERGEEGWARAKGDVEQWLSNQTYVEMETYGLDSLGRWLGDIYTVGDRANTLTQYMLRDRGWLPWVRG